MEEYVVVDEATSKTFLSKYHLDLLEKLKKMNIDYKVKYANDGISFKVLIPENQYPHFREALMREQFIPKCDHCGK